MFLEDSIVGLQLCQELHLALLDKISELFSAVLQQASVRDEPLCYAAVKVSKEQKWAQIILVFFHVTVDVVHISLQVCLQMFQLLSREIAPLVWDNQHMVPTMQTILQALLEIILGKVF